MVQPNLNLADPLIVSVKLCWKGWKGSFFIDITFAASANDAQLDLTHGCNKHEFIHQLDCSIIYCNEKLINFLKSGCHFSMRNKVREILATG